MKVIVSQYNKGKNIDIIFFSRCLCSIDIMSNIPLDSAHPLGEGEKYAIFRDIRYLQEVLKDNNAYAEDLTSFFIDMPFMSTHDCITNIIYFIINYCRDLDCKYLVLGYSSNILSYIKESKDILKTMGFNIPRRKDDFVVYQY